MPDILSVELQIDDKGADVVLSRTKEKLEDFVRTAEKAQPQIKFGIPNQTFIDLDKLEKRAAQTRATFDDIAKTRLDKGQLGFLTKEIVATSERARQLQTDILSIKRELGNPARTSSIAFLTSELKAAEREADTLNRKLTTLPSSGGAGGGRAPVGRRGITETQRALLEIADDFAPAGFNRPFNAVAKELLAATNANSTALAAKSALTTATTAQTAATVASTAATTAEGAAITATTAAVEAETAAFAGLSTASLGVFAGVAAVGYGIFKVTQNIRLEAERRLKVEESIAGAINGQILSQKQGLIDLQKARDEAAKDRDFNRKLGESSIEDLKRQKDYLEKIRDLTPRTLPAVENGKIVNKPNEDFQKVSQQLLALDAQTVATLQRNKQLADESFSRRFENSQKSQEQAEKYELARAEKQRSYDQKKLADAVAVKSKIEQIEKTALDTFGNLSAKSFANNPFVAIFTEGDQAARELEKTIRSLPAELQTAARAMQGKISFRQLLEAETSNKLATFDLRNDANNFRNPFDAGKQKKDQEDFIQNFLRNNPNYLFLQGKNSLDDETKAKILKQFGGSALNESPADRFNKTLREKADLLYKPNQSAEELAVADKRFISLTQGANPLDLSKDVRESAAVAREREAIRLEKNENEAKAEREADRKIRERLATVLEKLAETGGKNGVKAIDLILKNESEESAKLEKSPTRADTENYYSEHDQNYRIGDTRRAGALYR